MTNNKKRKSTGDLTTPGKNGTQSDKRRKTLDAYFTPQVLVQTPKENDASNHTRETISLNEEQAQVLRMVLDEGKNVYFTGPAGSGKSVLLRAIITALRNRYSSNPSVVSITASTGMAATNIGGITIHSWGALIPDVHNMDTLISRIMTCQPALKRWKQTKVLVMDEVSMVDGHLFNTLAKLARHLRINKKTQRPFGGIQLVVTGDFFQLPPVTKSGEEPFFAFECEAWKECIEHTVTLTEVFRQKDAEFVQLLNELRRGHISPASQQTFTSLSRPLSTLPSGIQPTELYALRKQVEHANATRLRSLPGSIRPFLARDTGRHREFLSQMVVPSKLEFKVDAQVMLVKNMDEKLVNGSIGRILGFHTMVTCQASVTPAAITKNTKPSSRSAATKPKSGVGSTSSSQHPKPESSAWKGSRAVRDVQVGSDGRTPIVLCGKNVPDKENAASASTGGLLDLAQPAPSTPTPLVGGKLSTDPLCYPLVEFHTRQGTENVLVVQDEFRIEDNEGSLLARRVQLPLVLAWAISIHKSQGQTLQFVKVDLGSVFETGQSYVALSRAATLDGLQVLGFDPSKVKAHAKVIAWSKSLSEGIAP